MNPLKSSRFALLVGVGLVGLLSGPVVNAQMPPACRLDTSFDALITESLDEAVAGFEVLGLELPFTKIVTSPTEDNGLDTLHVYVIRSATIDRVKRNSCGKRQSKALGEESLDDWSVRGGCVVTGDQQLALQCSAAALESFVGPYEANSGSVALLYVLAHELGHLHQGRYGEFSGRNIEIQLADARKIKREQLEKHCEPKLIESELAADQIALQVLQHALKSSRYKDPLLTQRGAMYWYIDQINLAAHRFQGLNNSVIAGESLHPTFRPTEFPTPELKVRRAAERFVCDVLTQETGTIRYPVRQTTHPAPEQRLRLVAEALKEIADTLPSSGGSEAFQSVSDVQEAISPLLAHLYRETGIYLQSIHNPSVRW